GFVHAADIIPDLREEIRYFGDENFVGRPIRGYLAPRCVLAESAAKALKRAQDSALAFGLALKVFDCYRPQQAVAHFAEWARDLDDTAKRTAYYPHVDKRRLFKDGYIAERSGHSRGATVDLTLVDATTGAELDMGTPFDFFSPLSWPLAASLSAQQRANRLLLRQIMAVAGYLPYE